MSHILITDPAGLREAIAFAENAGCIDQLGRDLVNLFRVLTVGMTKENDRKAELGTDFAPHSFSFAIWEGVKDRQHLVLNGGWIYAGPGAPGDGSFPSFSVNLSYVMGQSPKHSWTIHT